ncbi:chemotaxis protein CheX [Deltaproteobacteria bacterium TL4]
MRDQLFIESKLLTYECNETHREGLIAFCHQYNLKGVMVTHINKLIKTLKQNINIGGILLCDPKGAKRKIISEITHTYPEIPLFIRCDDPEWQEAYLQQEPGASVRFYKTNDFESLGQMLQQYIFDRIYPEGLVEHLREIVVDAIQSRFHDVHVCTLNTFLASDKRIFGERIELMPVRSSWCEGVMMLQSNSSDVDNLVLAGKTSFPRNDGKIAKYTEDLLRELMNQIWGGFKAKYVPFNFTGRPSAIEVPMTINHAEKYISFGTTNPLLSFKFVVEDNNQEHPSFEPFPLYLKFSFHLYWNVEDFTENQEVENMVEAGELEFF